ncbi:hypothetical protein DIPPA_14856 [Diplonema papillatum]|nr:hypothetical protein DIPPA_14856 [Diplonema papillatum]|eukprot:gene9038-13991_t
MIAKVAVLVLLPLVVLAAGEDAQEKQAQKEISDHMRKVLTTMCKDAKEKYHDHVGSKFRVVVCKDAVNHALHEIMTRVDKFAKNGKNMEAMFDDLRNNVASQWKNRYNVEDTENGSLYLQLFVLHQKPEYRAEMDKLLTTTGMKVDQVPGDTVPPKFTVYHTGDEEGEKIKEQPAGTQKVGEDDEKIVWKKAQTNEEL